MTKKTRDRFNLLCSIGDLASLVTGSQDMESFLRGTVELVSRHLEANVCSIYLYDEYSRELVLRSTLGLKPEAVGQIRMKPGEGLVGNVFEQSHPIRESAASCNPLFKYFEEAGEESFESFLAVPIQRGVQKIGVLVVQHHEYNYFNHADGMALRAAASQLAGAIENVRLLMNLHEANTECSEAQILEELQFIKGRTASDGYAFGPATLFKKSHAALLAGQSSLCSLYTLDDFYEAVHKTANQLMGFQSRLSERLPESASLIFTAHFMMLKDPKFMGKIAKKIEDGMSPPDAVRVVAKHYINIFASSSHAYIREKASDMEDLAGRILRNIYNHPSEDEASDKGKVIIARELYPSEILKMASEDVAGIVLVKGGITSHVSILARSLQIPLVIISDRPELLDLPENTPILVDARIGNVYVRPDSSVVDQFEALNQTDKTVQTQKITESLPLTHTRDSQQIHLMANINLLSEIQTARALNAEGVGLYRTEFPFIIRPTFPSEEEQFWVYKRLFDEMNKRSITIRTLDVGGDKVLVYSDTTSGENPELGLRSIRFSLHHPNIFRQQLRAILRAGADAENLRIMFPMISSLDEFQEARQIVYECIARLKENNTACHQSPKIGMMVEVPSLVEIIDALAREADFFSIGTNDFVQYTLAVDRTNERVADYYRPYHPSVLRGLSKIVKAVNSAGKDISVCGEMGHEPEYIPFLIGIGIRTLSVDPQLLPTVQAHVAKLEIPKTQAYAKALLAQETLKGTREILERYEDFITP